MPTASVASALAGSTAELGNLLLGLTEDQWFDRKSVLISPAKLAESLVAFANAEGGTVVIGLHGGRVEGILDESDRINSLRQAGVDLTQPPVRNNATIVDCVNESGQQDGLLVIEVPSSEAIHATTADVCYLRVGDENRKLTFGQRQELYFDKGQAQFDGQPLRDVAFEDLNESIVGEYAQALGSADGRRMLQARSLLTRDQRVTNGAYLLFGRHPQEFFPEAYVRVLRYRGTERGSGRRQELLGDERFEGALPELLRSASDAIGQQQPSRRILGRNGIFVREGLIPEDAWLEGLVNAVIHRSYSLGGDHIRVEIFDDRIEIESPGRFPGLVRLEEARAAVRFARNPRIARVCADLDYGQELGEGIRRMFEEMRLAGLGEPLYRLTPGSTVLTLSAVSAVPAHLQAQMSPDAKEIVSFLRRAGGVSTGDVVEHLGLSRPTVVGRLRALQEIGLVIWEGKSTNDPRATWRLALGEEQAKTT